MSERKSDKMIPWGFALFFVVQFALFAWFIRISYHSHTGVVTEDAYNKGLQYNDTITKAEAQKSLGWTAEITAAEAGGKKARVTLRLRDKDGKAITDARVRLWAIRPVQDGMDQNTNMRQEENGVYAATLNLPAPGLWEIRILAEKDGKTHQASQRVNLKNVASNN